jgi:hypothetical protein
VQNAQNGEACSVLPIDAADEANKQTNRRRRKLATEPDAASKYMTYQLSHLSTVKLSKTQKSQAISILNNTAYKQKPESRTFLHFNMASENEKLCMAIINNSSISNIKWQAVASELGMAKVNSVQKRWERFRKAKSFVKARAAKAIPIPELEAAKDVKIGANISKKRGAETMNEFEELVKEEGVEDVVARKLPSRKAKEKRVKYGASSGDEEQDDEHWTEMADQIDIKKNGNENEEAGFEAEENMDDDEA